MIASTAVRKPLITSARAFGLAALLALPALGPAVS
jgi:hypothetical protein